MWTDLSNQLADVVAATAPSVVQVQGRRRPASGIVYAPQVLLTTMQAIGREDRLQVRLQDGRTCDAELAGWDLATDLAILRTSLTLDATPLQPTGTNVRVGNLAMALARSWSNAITASAGIIAVIGGPLPTGRRRQIDQVFRTTAPMHSGFAGGVFLDAAGGTIGITTAESVRGFSVVIPATIAWKTAADLLEHGRIRRGFLGLAGHSVGLSDQQARAAGRGEAVLIAGLTAGAPAASAGVLVGDVLLAVDETSVSSPEDLLDVLLTTGAGRSVTLRILRGVTPMELSVTTVERPAN
jgi:S1-C subfamily serine protease